MRRKEQDNQEGNVYDENGYLKILTPEDFAVQNSVNHFCRCCGAVLWAPTVKQMDNRIFFQKPKKKIKKWKKISHFSNRAKKARKSVWIMRGREEVYKKENMITDEEVEAELKKEQEKNARTINVEDRPAADGDTVTLDFEGSVDGVPFDGGAGKDYPLTLGSHSFIPGFEEQLVGAALEEEKEVNVTFPEDYQAEELAGKAAVFKCTIHKIEAKELPALDDDFAKDVSEFDTLDEYKKEIKDNLTKKKEEQAKTEKENAVVDKAVENATMEIPEAMIDTQVENMVDDFARRIQSQGLSMEQYMQFTGATVDSLKEQMKPQAVKRIESRLVLEKVAEAENIQISDEKLDEELAKMAEMYKMELDKFKELVGEYEKEQMKKDLAVQEAVTLMADSAKEA